MGDPGGQPADAGELLHPDHVALGIEQLLGHGAVAVGEVAQLAGLVGRRLRRHDAAGQGLGLRGELLERPDDQPVHQVAPEPHENQRAAEPEHH